MRFWQALSFTETDQLVALARTCEEAGFDGIFLSDHVFVPGQLASRYPYSPDGRPPFDAATEHPEPWAVICAMAQVTTHLRFGTAVYLAPLRHPLHVAKSVATASVLSGGRVALGVGVGWVREEFDVLGQDFERRGARLEEMIEVMRKVWAGGIVEHHGRFYDLPPLAMEPRPVAPVPVWIGGTSPAALRRAARYDGWIGAGETPQRAPAVLARLRELRKAAQRPRSELQASEVRAPAGRAAQRPRSELQASEVRAPAGRAAQRPRSEPQASEALQGKEEGLGAPPFEAIIAVTGPPDVALYRRLAEAGATGIVSYPPAFALGPRASLDAKRRHLEQYGAGVIARYRAASAASG
jgi:probable F420-dependent oxidoreductase